MIQFAINLKYFCSKSLEIKRKSVILQTNNSSNQILKTKTIKTMINKVVSRVSRVDTLIRYQWACRSYDRPFLINFNQIQRQQDMIP